MALLGKNLDYTDKDFDALRERAFNLISGVFPQWTSQQTAAFGNLLVELFCFVGDVVTKYQDNQARESRWSQATQRKNLIALSKLISFEPSSATASQADVTISMTIAAAGDVTIPAGTIVRTEEAVDPVEFQLLTDVTITAGNLSATTTVENSESEQEIFNSTGAPDQSLNLTASPYIDGSAQITAGNGVFTEVDNFLDSGDSDLHFTVTVDQNDLATVKFGNGSSGVIPTGTITVDYKTGGGASGQVEAGTINVIEGAFTDSLSNSVQLFVTNASASTPATDRQTVAQIRQDAPLSIKTVNRTVSKDDYENNARKLPQVARALMLTSDQDSSIQENRGILFIVPVGGGQPTSSLSSDVLTQVTVTYPNTITFNVTVQGPLYKTIDVYAKVHFRKGYVKTAVAAAIRSNLETFFSIQNEDGSLNEDIDFGYSYVEEEGDSVGQFPFSDVYNVVRDSDGVKKIDSSVLGFLLNEEHSDVEMLLREFPVLGTVTIIDADTDTEVA